MPEKIDLRRATPQRSAVHLLTHTQRTYPSASFSYDRTKELECVWFSRCVQAQGRFGAAAVWGQQCAAIISSGRRGMCSATAASHQKQKCHADHGVQPQPTPVSVFPQVSRAEIQRDQQRAECPVQHGRGRSGATVTAVRTCTASTASSACSSQRAYALCTQTCSMRTLNNERARGHEPIARRNRCTAPVARSQKPGVSHEVKTHLTSGTLFGFG